MQIDSKKLSAILFVVVAVIGSVANALSALPGGTSALVEGLAVIAAVFAGAQPLVHDAHASKIAALLAQVFSEAQAAATPVSAAPAPTETPAPVAPSLDPAVAASLRTFLDRYDATTTVHV